jgi:hypothetical protein
VVFSPTGSIKPWFHTEGNLPLCSSYLPLGVPNWVAKHHQSIAEEGMELTSTVKIGISCSHQFIAEDGMELTVPIKIGISCD